MNSLWKSDFGSPTFDSINERFKSPHYRVSRSVVDGQSVISGSMLRGTCFVLAGVARIKFKDGEFALNVGDIVDLPEGKYRLERLSDAPVELVYVWSLSSNADDS